MKSSDINSRLIEGYLSLLNNLSTDSKLELISRLTLSVKTDIASKKNLLSKAFGAWDSKKSADEIINEIRNSRTFNREMMKL